MSVRQNDGQLLIVNIDGATYQLQTGAGCPSARQEVGRPVYMRSLLPLGTADADLILLEERETCAILAIEAAADTSPLLSATALWPAKS